MTERTIRVGFLGCGRISRMHVRALKAAPAARIAALADVNAENIATLRETFPEDLADVATYADYREMLATDLDGVVILTPHGLHYQHTYDALEAGKHVLCEKPFVTHPEQARELIALARTRERVLMLSYQNPWLWPYRYIRQQVMDGHLGEIVSYSAFLSQQWGVRAGGWRSSALGEGGFLVDTGSHFVDLMLYLTDMRPETVCAFSDALEAQVDIVTHAIVRYNGGHTASLATVGRGPALWHIVITGTGGTVEIADRDQIRHVPAEDYPGWIGVERRNLVPPAGERPETSTPDAEFVAAIRRGDHTVSDAQRGLVVAQLTQAIYASASASGAPVTITEFG